MARRLLRESAEATMTETTHQDVDETLTTQPAQSEPLSSDPDLGAQPSDGENEVEASNETEDSIDAAVDAADQPPDTNI